MRYDLPLLPLLCLPFLADASARSPARRWAGYVLCALLGGAQLALQLLYARRFHQGHWGF